MTAQQVVDLRVGARLWLDGAAWEVVEFAGDAVRLRSGDQIRSVSAFGLLGLARSMAGEDADDQLGTSVEEADLGSVLLASLTAKQREKLERMAACVRQVLEPSPSDERTVDERIAAQASQLGVSARTLYRQMLRYQQAGAAGLVDARQLRRTRRSVDPRWDSICLEVLASYRDASNPTVGAVIARVNAEFHQLCPGVDEPSRTVAYRRVKDLDKGRYTFDSAKNRRSVAERPTGVFGRLQAVRPGQYIVMDTYTLDVFAMEPVTLQWVKVELTVAMDLYSRCVTGLQLRPVAAKSPDVAGVLFQTVTPQQWGRGSTAPRGPFIGVPEAVVLGDVGLVPDTIVVDHGKVYLSAHVMGLCSRLGIAVQPAIPHKPTDKPTLERFFKTLRESLLQHLPAYKGPDIHSRGKDVEKAAFLYVGELEQVIREWIGTVYHRSPHSGLRVAQEPSMRISPAEMFERGMAQSGTMRIPASADLIYDFLQVEWRTIQHYGVEIRGQRYNGPALNLHRGTRSTHGGAHAGKWPFMVDPDDVRQVHFKDPDDGTWHRLEWEHAASINAPFSQDAADYARRMSLREHRHVEPHAAVRELLTQWGRDVVTDRRDRNLARRLSALRAQAAASPKQEESVETQRDRASTVGVIDLLEERDKRAGGYEVADDLDVFERYYAQHPEGGFEVFDE